MKKVFVDLKMFLVLLALLIGQICYGQDQSQAEMADVMRSNGKIYVVIAVLLVIFLGIIFYLISIDRKVSRLEKEMLDKEK